MRFSSAYALTASLSTAAAVSQGFNYGATKADGTYNYEADFESLFSDAQGLTGTNGGFTSARLYTMIQGGSSTNEPTEAIEAAITTGTTLLLGLWASGDQAAFDAELSALKSALSASNAAQFAKQVIGISVGSEDLYRNSSTGQAADAGVGVDALTVSTYMYQLKQAIVGTALADAPVGHVDTWTAWAQSDDPNLDLVIGNASWIGVDAYPYFQDTMANSISLGKSLFDSAISATQAVVGSKEIWITETGFPVSGATSNEAVPSLANAKTYWDQVGCPLFGVTNTFWYTLQDTNGAATDPSFGVIGSSYTTTPLFDLSCSNVSSSSSSSSSSGSSTSTAASSVSSASVAVVSASGSSVSGSAVVSAVGSSASASSGGVTQTQSAGNGTGASASASAPTTGTGTGSTPTATGSGNSSVHVGTLTSSTSTSSSTTSVVSTGGATALSGSFIGLFAALLVAVVAL